MMMLSSIPKPKNLAEDISLFFYAILQLFLSERRRCQILQIYSIKSPMKQPNNIPSAARSRVTLFNPKEKPYNYRIMCMC